MGDLYKILGLTPSATGDEIKQRFRYLAQAYHPDKFASDKNKIQAEEDFKRISAAYQVLSNPKEKALYDAERLISRKHTQQRDKKRQQNHQPATFTKASSPKLKQRRSKWFLWVTVLIFAFGIMFFCLIGSVLFNTSPTQPQANTQIVQITNTPTPYKTTTPTLSIEVASILTEVSASATPSPTPQAIGESIVINEQYSDAVWEISIEKIIFSDSLTSPLTGSVDKASGRFAIIFLSVTNRGLSTDSFVTTMGSLDIYDAEGNVYSEHLASMSAQEIYNVEYGLAINPDSTAHIVVVFDISSSSDFYIFKPSNLVKSNSSGLYLAIP